MGRPMALQSHSFCIPLLLISIFHASDNRHVYNAGDIFNETGNPEVDNILSQIPITLPEGTDLSHVNIKRINIQLGTGMKEQLTALNLQLQEMTQSNSQLNKEAFGLRREIRQLNLKLATCSSTLSSITGSYQSQLQSQMNNLLDVIDSETFQILKIMAITRDVGILQKKLDLAVNSDKNYTDIAALQKDLDQKRDELEAKTKFIDRSNETLTLILQIISLQNHIWDLHQTELNAETAPQPDRRILVLQEQLDRKITELQEKPDALSDVLELVSVNTKISALEERIRVLTEQSKSQTADAERQWRQKTEQLKQAILLLNTQESNTSLTRQILLLQNENEQLEKLVKSSKERVDMALTEALEAAKKRETFLQRKLEEADYATTQLIVKIISIMEELRNQRQTSTGQPQDILTLLQTYKKDYITAQNEIKTLQKKVRQMQKECSGVEEKYRDVKRELEEKITKLNQTDDSKAALVLTVINLQGEINALKQQISTSADADMIPQLQKKLLEKQEEMNHMTAKVQRLIDNPRTILEIIEVQNDIWVLQNKSPNETADRIKELQDRVEGLISEMNDNNSIKQMMTIMMLQSQVEYLQKLLSNAGTLESSKIIQLTNEVEAKEGKIKQHINELMEKDKENALLILKITELQNELRNLDKEKQTKDKETSATESQLKDQLRIKVEENQQHQTLIKTLQNSLKQKEAQCSAKEQKITELQDHLDSKIDELTSKSDTVTALSLKISVLTAQLEELNEKLKNSVSNSKAAELQRIIDEKSAELNNKTKELKQRSNQAQRILEIVALQLELEKLVTVAANDSDYAKIQALQEHLTSLIDGIQDKDNENTKLMFQILSHQDEITRLKKQEESHLKAQADRIKELENELLLIRNEIKRKTQMLDSSTMMVANLTAQIMELHKKIKPLEDERSNLKETYAENLAELQERLNVTKSQLEDVDLQLKNSNAKNIKLMMEVIDLRAYLKKAQKQESKAADKHITDLEQQIKTKEFEKKKLESTNKDLKQQVEELKMCCTADAGCDDVQRQLQQSQDYTDHLHQQLKEKDAFIRQLRKDLEIQRQATDNMKEYFDTLTKKLNDTEEQTIHTTRMTMDPETAHPRISLSADGTEISTTVEAELEDHPGRFDVVLAVLGATGFASGKHYWEVSVAGKSCYHIGMASESAPRKGSLSFHPTNGFWTIVLNKVGDLKALDVKHAVIKAYPLPLTVGILLDYSKGQVSFYDAGARSHLYSFTGQRFRDQIYPFVNYCVEDVEIASPLVLVSPGSTNWIK